MRGRLLLVLVCLLASSTFVASGEGPRCVADPAVERIGQSWELNLTWSPRADASFYDVLSRLDGGAWKHRATVRGSDASMHFGSEPRGLNEYALAVDGAFDPSCPTATIHVTWGPEPVPTDLALIDSEATAPLVAGNEVAFGVLVENAGSPTSVPVVVRFKLDHGSVWLGDVTIPAGFQGRLSVVSPQTWVVTEGRHEFRAVVDVESAVAEPDEGNNVLSYLFEVTPPREVIYRWSTPDFYMGPTVALLTEPVVLTQAYEDIVVRVECRGEAAVGFAFTTLLADEGRFAGGCVAGHAYVSVQDGMRFWAGEYQATLAWTGIGHASVEVTGVRAV